MAQVTKPYGDFTNNVDVADANKVNAQINALYTLVNGQQDDGNMKAGVLDASVKTSTTAAASTIPRRDANGNVVSAFPADNGQNPNLLFNPSGRLGMNGWSLVSGANSWSASFDSYGGGGWFQSPNTSPASGVYQVVEGQKIPVSASIPLTVSAEIDTSHLTAGNASIEIHAYDSNNNDIGSTGVVVNFGSVAFGSAVVTKSSFSYTTPANTAYVKVRLITSSAAVGYALFRKVKAEWGNYPTTFSDDNTLNTNQYGSALGLAQILSGGYKVQSGSVSATAAGSYTITFPTAFSSLNCILACYYTNGTANTAVVATVTATSATSATVYINGGNSGGYIEYIAIGT